MASNAQNIYEHYGSGVNEDDRAISSRSQSLEFYFTEKTMEKFITPDSCILEIGCAKGYYAERFFDKCKQYVGVDIHSPHTEIFKKKITDQKMENVSCQIGDAVHLSDFPMIASMLFYAWGRCIIFHRRNANKHFPNMLEYVNQKELLLLLISIKLGFMWAVVFMMI